MTFGERLRAFRKQAHLTQKELGEKAGLAEINIRQYEAGKYTPKPESGRKIAVALGVSVSDLYGWDENGNHLESIRTGLKFIETDELNRELMEGFSALNQKGKRKAVDYINDLSQISEYQQPKESEE